MQCLRCVVEREHRKPFLQCLVFFWQSLYWNCVKLKYAPCVVSSSGPNDLIWKPPGPDAQPKRSKRSVALSPPVGFWSGVCIGGGGGPPVSCYSICFSPWKQRRCSAGKSEAAVHCCPRRVTQVAHTGHDPTIHTKLLQKVDPHISIQTWLMIEYKQGNKRFGLFTFVGIFNVQSLEIILTEYTFHHFKKENRTENDLKYKQCGSELR